MTSHPNSYPTPGPEPESAGSRPAWLRGPAPEYDETGEPTEEWAAAYSAWVNSVLDDGQDDDEGQDDVDGDAAVEAGPAVDVVPVLPEGTFYDQEADELQSSGALAITPSELVHLVPDAEWIAAYDARHGIGPAAGGRTRPSWLHMPKPHRRPLGEAAVMRSEAAALTGVVIPRELGPVVVAKPDADEPAADVVSHWEALVVLAGEAAQVATERWEAEAERRRVIRAELRPQLRDAERALRAARRADPEGKQAATHAALRTRDAVRKQMPQAMGQVAIEATAGTVGAGAMAWYEVLPRMSESAWMWAGGTGLVLAACGVRLLVSKVQSMAGALRPTAEERALLTRLSASYWVAHAEARGLDKTVTGTAVLGAAGITVAVRLDGKWTVSSLTAAEENIRALLGCRTELRIQIEAGDRGGWARMSLRTRLAVDNMDLSWSYATPGFGVNMVTGEEIPNTVAIGRRALIAGTSGAGKSVASRPLLFAASEGELHALIIIDLKKVEGRLWDHRARVASTPAEILTVCAEIVAEMDWRLDRMPKGQASWTPTVEHPRLTVVVDEGAEVMSSVKKAVAALESVARMGRAPAIDLSWMTQKPTINDGIPKQIAPQLILRIGLAVTTGAESRVVFGEDAQARGWDAENLPMPGVALIRDGAKGRKSRPEPIAVRHMTDEQVIALPDQPIWHGPAGSGNAVGKKAGRAIPGQRGPVDEDDQDDAEDTGSAPSGPAATDERVLQLVREAGRPVRQADIAEAAGVSRPTLSRSVGRLVGDGRLAKGEDGTLTPGKSA